jgi:hypothetical protein
MKITPDLFEAYLKCPMKCWLRAAGEAPTENPYAEWVKTENESYRASETARLVGGLYDGEVATNPEAEHLKSARWQLATNLVVSAPYRSADSHVRETVPDDETCGLSGPRSEVDLTRRRGRA